MTLDPNRWTLKATEAFSAATELGRSASHPEIVPEHLLLALLGQELCGAAVDTGEQFAASEFGKAGERRPRLVRYEDPKDEACDVPIHREICSAELLDGHRDQVDRVEVVKCDVER